MPRSFRASFKRGHGRDRPLFSKGVRRPVDDIIARKRDGRELSGEEIEFALLGYVRGTAPVRQRGGDPQVVDDPDLLPQAKMALELSSPTGGYIAAIDAREAGSTCVQLGTGRTALGDFIDDALGI